MTKLENNINNLCVENMGIYGCKHAVKEHVWTGKAHMIAKLKKNVKSMLVLCQEKVQIKYNQFSLFM